MAPVSDRVYFPPIGQCLEGETLVLSWKLVASALSDTSGCYQTCPAVSEFLADEYVHELFRAPLSVFSPEDQSSAAAFETKTAAIHVTPSPNNTYDIKAVKEDAQWLSKTAGINQVAALRIIVIEVQSRAENHLRGPLSSQEASNLQEAAGVNNSQTSTLLLTPGTSAVMDAEAIFDDFESQTARKQRLFSTYLAERRYFMMVADYIRSLVRFGRLPTHSPIYNQDLRALYRLKFSPTHEHRKIVPAMFQAYKGVLERSMDGILTGFKAIKDETVMTEDMNDEYNRTILVELLHALSVIFQDLDHPADTQLFAPPGVVMGWFKLMTSCAYFTVLDIGTTGVEDLILPIKTLITAITLKLLCPTRTVAFLSDEAELYADEEAYVTSPSLLEDINVSITNAAERDIVVLYPAILAWCVILHRMFVSFNERAEHRDDQQHVKSLEGLHGESRQSSSGRRASAGSIISLEARPLDVFLQKAGLEKDMQIVEQMAMATTSGGRVYDVVSEMASCFGASVDACFPHFLGSRVRAGFIDFLKACYPLVGYQSDPVTTFLTVISGEQQYWDTDSSSPSRENDAVALMLEDSIALGYYLQNSLSRYPFEFLPFVGFCKALCGSFTRSDGDELIINLLRQTPTLTFVLPESFQQYELAQEDENTNTFRILVDLPIFTPRSNWSKRAIEHDAFQIPAGTFGRFVTDSGRVVLMEYKHSGVALLGSLLEVSLTPEAYNVLIGTLGLDEIAETISLLAHLIRAEHLRNISQTDNKHALDLLDEISRCLSGNRDIISVVCDALDTYMQDDALAAEGPAISVLTSCVNFLDAVLPLCPTRVWSYLARCQLLSSESQAGRLGRIVGNLDLVAERFDFLISSLGLFSRLVDTALTSAVQRKCGHKLTSRNKEAMTSWIGMADKIMSKVSLAIAQTAVDVFENSSTWRFASDARQTLLMRDVVGILSKLITYTYGMGDLDKEDALMACLHPASAYVIECFLSPAVGTLRFQPLLATLITAFQFPDSTLYPSKHQSTQDALSSVVEFTKVLLRVANYLEMPAILLETHLFKVSSLLVRLCAANCSTSQQILHLLEALAVSAGISTNEPQSLLGYLGPQISQSFLRKVAKLGKPFALEAEVKSTWEFFSAIVRNRQQWMTNCLLTGRTPREALKGDDKKTDTSSNSLLGTAFTRLKSIKNLQAFEVLAILDFVTSAQNYWPWTTFTMEKDPSFLDSLREYVHDLPASNITARSDPSRAAREARAAAYVAETFAMQLFHLRQMGKASAFAKKVVADLDYFLREGVEVSGYNSSLHSNFAKNFLTQYPGCPLESFKRTLLSVRDLGGKYYYDLDHADEMLGFDPGWRGAKGNGFRSEMERANLNLSLVDAQISLFHAWEFLLLELSSCMSKDNNLARQMLQVAQRCLNANLSSQGPENIFVRIIEARANLALTIVQRLVGTSLSAGDVNHLLGTLSAVINSVEEPFASESVAYYRTLLKILYVTLRAYTDGERKAAAAGKASGLVVTVTQTVLGLLDRVVAKGFRELVTLIHDPEASVLPEDITLLTAILQACLAVPAMDQCQMQVQNIMASYDAMHVATSLFSWADKLADKGDPIYGELSLLFLLELSTMPKLAEQLACDGLLGQLTSASITNYMRRPIISPFADAIGPQRCYSIWARGILPLLLNMLTALGATIAPEVAYVLNQFPHLLQSSVDRFEAPGASRTASVQTPHYVTLLAVSEVHSLALLTKILAAFRANNNRDIPEVEWDASVLLENVDFWLSGRKLLRERILPLGQRELDWRNMKVGEEGNMLEERAIAQLESVRDVLSADLE